MNICEAVYNDKVTCNVTYGYNDCVNNHKESPGGNVKWQHSLHRRNMTRQSVVNTILIKVKNQWGIDTPVNSFTNLTGNIYISCEGYMLTL